MKLVEKQCIFWMEDNVVRIAIVPQMLNGIAIKISITWRVFFFGKKIIKFFWTFPLEIYGTQNDWNLFLCNQGAKLNGLTCPNFKTAFKVILMKTVRWCLGWTQIDSLEVVSKADRWRKSKPFSKRCWDHLKATCICTKLGLIQCDTKNELRVDQRFKLLGLECRTLRRK